MQFLDGITLEFIVITLSRVQLLYKYRSTASAKGKAKVAGSPHVLCVFARIMSFGSRRRRIAIRVIGYS